MSGADLHAHTTASDGTYTPPELVREAVRRGLRALAITDHDSTEGVEPALATAREHPPLEIVPGIEINTDASGAEIHILGYFVDHAAEWFRALLRGFREERARRVYRMTERLTALGLPIDPAEVFALVREGSAGRPHVAQVMVQRGYVATVKEAFDRYLHAGGPGYVSHRKVTPGEACALVHRAGGLAVLAHPGFQERSEALVRELAGQQLLEGVECYYAEHTPAQTARFIGLCRELGLVTTGGSDFHGPAVRASTLGQPPVPWAAYEELRRRAGR
ncbi:MAG: PHP domain-containing protein [Candidatus Rokubacteria bacterium]|nr:PHP domain-containing protein [Candidatus Rokubacteria bacterium]